jgi:hypothetical protein
MAIYSRPSIAKVTVLRCCVLVCRITRELPFTSTRLPFIICEAIEVRSAVSTEVLLDAE